jgi:protein-S-isoprenylcysteine O-methyltransferase Ste14
MIRYVRSALRVSRAEEGGWNCLDPLGKTLKLRLDLFRRSQFYSNVVPDVLLLRSGDMAQRFWPISNTAIFTIVVPGTVAILVPRWLLGGFRTPPNGLLLWVGGVVFCIGALIYFRCAWEFAARGLGTPAPMAPTKYLVTTALHRYVRNPMYIGVALAIIGEAIVFRSIHVAIYAAMMLLIAHVFVVRYEEPTLRRQFGEPYEEYRRKVPRWIPRLRAPN